MSVGWSDLLIEKGTRDPLGLWRVGDRMISYLLGPFTTVARNRPARYLTMYCWILRTVESNTAITDQRSFWKHFYRLEAVLICAITLHQPHDYEGFAGQIGVDSANELLRDAVDGEVDLTDYKGISNGWDRNYKGPMQQLGLIEPDLGRPSGLALTAYGKLMADAFGESIRASLFYRGHLGAAKVPVPVLRNLSERACTCRLHAPDSASTTEEHRLCTQLLLTRGTHRSIDLMGDSALHDSILLILLALTRHRELGLPFSLRSWRRLLSTEITEDGHEVEIPERLIGVFRKWQFYNLDALLCFSLEQGLSGFLEFLHSNGGTCMRSDFDSTHLSTAFDAAIEQLEGWQGEALAGSAAEALARIATLPDYRRLSLETTIVERAQNTSGIPRVVFSYMLFLYTNSVFGLLRTQNDSAEHLSFYVSRSSYDGRELSLESTFHRLSVESNEPTDTLSWLFLEELVIGRQLETRTSRTKEQAWISYTRETESYDWESEYYPQVYRAARLDIFMNYLLSLGLAYRDERGWRAAQGFPGELDIT